jgi:hypothetical protein
MRQRRREFLQTALSATLLAGTSQTAAWGLQATGRSQQPSQQRDPAQPPSPSTFPDADIPRIDPKAILKGNQKQIQDDVKRLYALATELKEQAEKTDATAMLSLPMVRKAEEIEKLARQIKNLAKN